MTNRDVALLAGRVLTPDEVPGAAGVLVRGGKVVRLLLSREEVPAGAGAGGGGGGGRGGGGRGVRLLRAGGGGRGGAETGGRGAEAILAPGLIDVHTHGGWGLRYTHGPEAARTVLRRRAESGCTGLLLT